MLQIDKTIKKPYYVQIYEYFRCEIEERRMHEGERLASVRELSQAVNVSKMTIEQAYFQLASEGYILRRNRARYEVAPIGEYEEGMEAPPEYYADSIPRPEYIYDFGSGDMDMERFPLDIWRRYMNRVLTEPERLLACGDEQGVLELRQALSHYVYQERGVHAFASTVVIGAGTLPLLRILASLLREEYPSIGVEEPGFRLGREIFRSNGYAISPFAVHDGEIDIEALARSDVRLVYVSPSHQFPTGTVMPAGRRNDLLQWAEERDGLIIEDDYDSELRYYGRPVPALQGIDRSGRVIYMGSLSKVLPSFVRLSYMVLPPRLMKRYNEQRELFRQGASVPEQCVLAEYIRSGELARQIRRLRKDYQEKGQTMIRLLQTCFGETVEVKRIVSGVYCRITLHSSYSEEELLERARQQGCRVLSMNKFYEIKDQEIRKEFLLSFSKIPTRKLEQAICALHRAWTEKEGE